MQKLSGWILIDAENMPFTHAMNVPRGCIIRCMEGMVSGGSISMLHPPNVTVVDDGRGRKVGKLVDSNDLH